MIQYWGPKTWRLIHCVGQNYPSNPTIVEKKQIIQFIYIIPYILPCSKCQYHFLKQLREYPIKNHLNSKKTLSLWLYRLHNNVNSQNNKPTLSYKEANKLYYNKLYIDDINKLLLFFQKNVQYGHLNSKTYNSFIISLHQVFPVFKSHGGYGGKVIEMNYRK